MDKNWYASSWHVSNAAQVKFCEDNKCPHFAPYNNCYSCNNSIYSPLTRNGKITWVTLKKATEELITSCPHCNRSYCD